MKRIIVCFLLCIVAVCAFAQTNTILKGIVVDTDLKGNINPIQGALVRWTVGSEIVSTDSNGIFNIPFSSNTKHLIVSYVGYKTDTIFVANKNFVKVLKIQN